MSLISQTKENGYYITTWKHSKPFNELLTCSANEFETVLELASEALKSLRQSASSLEFQDILTKKINELEQKKLSELQYLKNQYEQTKLYETSKLQKEIKDLQINLEQSIKSYQVLNQNFLTLQTSNQENFDKSLNNVLVQQKQSFETQHAKVEALYKEQIYKLQDSLDQYTKHAINQNVSSNKGKLGEQSFDVMVENFTTWSIEDTSKTPQSCDRFGDIRGCKTLFEIKNYSYNIPRKEVDKFKRDLEIHKDCPLGIFISLNTNIVGGSQDFFFTEFTSSNQLLIYIQQFNNYDPCILFSILDSLIDIAKLLHSKCDILESDTNLQSKVDSIKPILQNEINAISNMMKDLQNNTKFLIDTLQKNSSSMKHNLEKLQFTFKTILQTLFEESMDISSEDVQPPKKKNARRKKTPTNEVIIAL